MPIPRKEQVAKRSSGHYHCISRAVRRAFLCGVDAHSGCNYEHRREWIVERLALLASQFSVEVCAYAIMSNHYHLVLHVNYEQSVAWSDEEVVNRWCVLFPDKNMNNKDLTDYEKQMRHDILLHNTEKVALWRARLADLSWFMRCLNEPIARQANHEDNCTGRFWEGRFKSQALLDEAALTTCMAYVDLNPVRAGIAETPEESEFTSIAARIEADKTDAKPTTCTLMPFAHKKKTGLPNPQDFQSYLPISQDEYFQLVDWTGRTLRDDKRGAIPAHLTPILQRLKINENNWIEGIEHYGSYFYRVVGALHRLKEECTKQGRHWLKGQRAAKMLYKVE